MSGVFHFRDKTRLKCGFSLVELLMVIAVMVMVASLAAPAFQTMAMGNALTRSAYFISDQFALARQEATGRNHDVQVRFIWLPEGCRAIQLWVPSSRDATQFVPLGAMRVLPDGILIAATEALSPLIAYAPIAKTEGTFARGTLPYCGFRFRASGGTDLGFHSTNNFISVVYAKDGEATHLPANYGAVQVDAQTGRVKVFRP